MCDIAANLRAAAGAGSGSKCMLILLIQLNALDVGINEIRTELAACFACRAKGDCLVSAALHQGVSSSASGSQQL